MAAEDLTDVVGSRGEQIFYLAATDYSEFIHPLFRPYFLGEKCPDVDFLVNLWGARGIFFVQVKTTTSALTSNSIEVRLTRKQRQKLMDLPGPTYLVGVQLPEKRCFIRSIHRSSETGITTIALANELHAGNLKKLFDEVKAFWENGSYKPQQSCFS